MIAPLVLTPFAVTAKDDPFAGTDSRALSNAEQQQTQGEGIKEVITLGVEAVNVWRDVVEQGTWVYGGAYGEQPQYHSRINRAIYGK